MKPYFEDESVTIYHGDCRELLGEMPRVDLVLTDPPYGISISNRPSHLRHLFKWDALIEQALFNQLITFAPKAIMWGGNYYHTPPSACWLVWDKDNTGDFADCELAFTTLRGAARLLHYRWNGCLQEPHVPRQVRQHLTEKPIPLMRWCVGLAKDVQTMIDPFMGGGTSLRAAKDCGIKAIGIEIEERYCEIAARRMAQQVLEFEPQPQPVPQQMSMTG